MIHWCLSVCPSIHPSASIHLYCLMPSQALSAEMYSFAFSPVLKGVLYHSQIPPSPCLMVSITTARYPLPHAGRCLLPQPNSPTTGLQIYGGPGSLSHNFKIWPITFQGSGPSGPILFSCEKSHFNKNIHL